MLIVEWHDSGKEPQCKPNPDYPNGKDLDVSNGNKSCFRELPYPAKRIGHFIVECSKCGKRIAITTAGRPDDPRSVKIECGETLQ